MSNKKRPPIVISATGGDTANMMVLPPAAYGITNHETWRPGQGEAVMALHQCAKKYIVLEAVTGSGKSAIAQSFSKTAGEFGKGVRVFTITHSLLNQYAEEYEFAELYGKQVYPCALHTSAVIPINADSCTEKVMARCPVADECEYLLAKSNLLRSDKQVLTYHYALKQPPWMSQYPTATLFLDECHKVPELVMSAYELIITEKFIERNDLPPINIQTDNATLLSIRFMSWLQDAQLSLTLQISDLEEEGTASASSKATKLGSVLSHLEMIHSGYKRNTDDFRILPHVDPKRVVPADVEEWHVAPLTAAPFAKYALQMSHYDKVIFSSATVGDAAILMGSLGIPDSEWEFFSITSQFPPQAMPVLVPDTVLKVSYNMTAATKEVWFDQMYKILTQPRRMQDGSKLALIHVASKNSAWEVLTALKRRGLKGMWIPPEEMSTKEKFDEWKTRAAQNKELITISWAFYEGLDAPELYLDIVAKIPFGMLNPLGKLRKDRSPEAYVQNAANSLIQAVGRQRRGNPKHYEDPNKHWTEHNRQAWLLDQAGVSYVKKYYPPEFTARLTSTPIL